MASVMKIKRIVALLIAVAVICTALLSVTVLASESVGANHSTEEVMQNPKTDDVLFGVFSGVALASLCVLYFAMRRKYVH